MGAICIKVVDLLQILFDNMVLVTKETVDYEQYLI